MTLSKIFSKKQKIKSGRLLRSRRGTTMAEFGPTMLLGFVVMVFPLLALGTLGLRYLLLMNAAETAAESAAKSENFLADIPSTSSTGTTTYNYSAVTTANNISQLCCNGIGNGSVHWLGTQTSIYVCPMGSTTTTTPGAGKALPAAADSVNNTYNCQVKIHATLDPMFSGAKAFIGNIPGFNTPIDCYCVSSRVFESTANLNN